MTLTFWISDLGWLGAGLVTVLVVVLMVVVWWRWLVAVVAVVVVAVLLGGGIYPKHWDCAAWAILRAPRFPTTTAQGASGKSNWSTGGG